MRWGWTTLVGLGVLGLAGRTVAQDAPSQNFFFYWPETSRQCEVSRDLLLRTCRADLG